MAVDLHGALAGMLSLAAQTKKPLTKSDFSKESTKLVAVARNQLNLLIIAPDFSAWRYAS